MPNAGTEVITVNECLNTVECRVFKTDSGIPAALYGAESEKIFLCVHEQFGNKFEAESFARIAVPLGWQVLAVDLPEHGERAGNSSARFDPWHSVPELHGIISSLRSKNKRVALRAVSIGAWFSLLAARGISLECCLLVSPLLNMERMIADMMRSANISEDTLKEVGEIVVPNGTVLSYDYLLYARNNPPTLSCLNAKVLWGENDAVVPFDTVEAFCKANHCGLTVMPAGEHWFHTAEQCKFLSEWESAALAEFGI